MNLDWWRGFRSSVMMNGGGRILVVTNILLSEAPGVILTFQTSILSVVIGGMVSVVVFVIRSNPVDVDTWPFGRVVLMVVFHATWSEVVKSGKETVVAAGNFTGGKMKSHGGMQ